MTPVRHTGYVGYSCPYQMTTHVTPFSQRVTLFGHRVTLFGRRVTPPVTLLVTPSVETDRMLEPLP
jgi:hypothetical protein